MEVKPGLCGYRYLLVFLDTFFKEWTEPFPIKCEVAAIILKKLEEIIPRYGLPMLMDSENGPAFISQVTQQIKVIGTNWKLHCAYCPQSLAR